MKRPQLGRELVDEAQIVWAIDTEVDGQPQLGGGWKGRESQTKVGGESRVGQKLEVWGAGPLEARRDESHGESRRVKARQRRDDALRCDERFDSR